MIPHRVVRSLLPFVVRSSCLKTNRVRLKPDLRQTARLGSSHPREFEARFALRHQPAVQPKGTECAPRSSQSPFAPRKDEFDELNAKSTPFRGAKDDKGKSTMSRRKSFTERRRARLAMKGDRLDCLETRNTITEPVSVTGLSITALRGLALIGVMGTDDALSAATGATQKARENAAPSPPNRLRAPLLGNFVPTTISLPHHNPFVAAGGSSIGQPGAANSATRPASSDDGDWLTLNPTSNEADASSGMSTPWQPSARMGGGAAMAPRGGSGNGALPVTQALVKGQVAPLRVPPPPPTTPAIPFLPPTGGAPGTGPIGGAPTGPVSHSSANAPAGNPSGSLSASPATAPSTPVGPTGPVVIGENPSSLPYRTTSNFSGASMEEFQ
jgi:hypothetical protein